MILRVQTREGLAWLRGHIICCQVWICEFRSYCHIDNVLSCEVILNRIPSPCYVIIRLHKYSRFSQIL